MEYLERVGEECRRELKRIGIDCGKVEKYKVKESMREWGMCMYMGDGRYYILINSLLTDKKHEEALKTIMLHELIHTLPDCIHHTKKWCYYANIATERLGYEIQKTYGANELDISGEEYADHNGFKYLLQCQSCHNILGYKRKIRPVRIPIAYKCSICGGELVRIL